MVDIGDGLISLNVEDASPQDDFRKAVGQILDYYDGDEQLTDDIDVLRSVVLGLDSGELHLVASEQLANKPDQKPWGTYRVSLLEGNLEFDLSLRSLVAGGALILTLNIVEHQLKVPSSNILTLLNYFGGGWLGSRAGESVLNAIAKGIRNLREEP
jgi:hypothetical protein